MTNRQGMDDMENMDYMDDMDCMENAQETEDLCDKEEEIFEEISEEACEENVKMPDEAADVSPDSDGFNESAKEAAKGNERNVEGLMRENERLKDGFLRLAAEFDNYKKRTKKEKENLAGDIKASVISKFLPVLDNLERAAISIDSDPEKLREGLALILKQFAEFLSAEGVSEIEAVGAEFNPAFHNAVMHEEKEGLPQNTITEVFQKGYKIGQNKVIRYSSVKVAN